SSFLLISADRTQKIFKVVGCGALINIFLNFLLIPRWGIMGAAVSTCFTELFVFGVYYKTISKIFEPLGILSLVWRPLAGSGVMVLLLEYFSFLPLVVLIFIGVAVYLTLLAAFQTFNQADIKTLRRLLGCG
ncbi:MAG: polysaccharide biosynthesis C-terminal domain-containing protein, partial [Nitrospinota bacterium]|nr:polysaccharide biosynthesis C-terminal domain-containing protein [Nitrospinota bacterium]